MCRSILLSFFLSFLSFFFYWSGCAAVTGGRLQATHLMCSGVVTLATMAILSWQKWPCGFIYTEKGSVCLLFAVLGSPAGRPLD